MTTAENINRCWMMTCSETLMMKAQPPRRFPPQGFHLLAVLELVDLLQGGAVVFHALHVTATVLKEAEELVVDDVVVLNVCEDTTAALKPRRHHGNCWKWREPQRSPDLLHKPSWKASTLLTHRCFELLLRRILFTFSSTSRDGNSAKRRDAS